MSSRWILRATVVSLGWSGTNGDDQGRHQRDDAQEDRRAGDTGIDCIERFKTVSRGIQHPKDDEIQYWVYAEQQKAQYQEEMIPTEIVDIPLHEETDELYDDAVQLVTELQTASVSMLQRRFRVGYSRAARIVDQMEMRGVVGPPDGSRPRQVLVSKEEADIHS